MMYLDELRRVFVMFVWIALVVFFLYLVWWINCLRDKGDTETKENKTEKGKVSVAPQSKNSHSNDECESSLLIEELSGAPLLLKGQPFNNPSKWSGYRKF
uniref:hypothetical protein n=1 Tax=Shewanella algae TaxID=38313 RepID=UPI000B34462E